MTSTGNQWSLSIEGANFIRRMEGERAIVYLDAGGLPTAGVGHLLSKVEARRYAVGTLVPSVKINSWFAVDCTTASSGAQRLFYTGRVLQAWQLQQATFDALCSFVFNLGEGAIRGGAKTMTAWGRGDIDRFCRSMTKWNNVMGADGLLTPNKGLAWRRAAEVSLIRDGKYS
ncbi:MAG: glycoside hydrolase family protein [Alphaproteobacteria bacterium]|nr:glycoside hydrolase family protein [Alphaproteobacteria bacterium]